MYNALDIASYFIFKGLHDNRPISNMKLQKLLYYAQGWYMALHGRKLLFQEDFKKWLFGPVCPPVYDRFKNYGSQPITEPFVYTRSPMQFDPAIKDFLDKIWNLYGKYSAVQLSRLSHREDPWLDASDLAVIPKEDLYAYFCKEKSKVAS